MVALRQAQLSETRNPPLFLCNSGTIHFLTFQVAIHSVVEKLFRSIWSLPNNKAPVAIKYFFDFLDAQAESKKITDPDVVHIWKTNRYARMICAGVHALSENVMLQRWNRSTVIRRIRFWHVWVKMWFGFVDPSNFSILIGYRYKPP